MSKNVKGPMRPTAPNSATNAISFIVENMVKGMVTTADVVIVESVDAGGSGEVAGYVSVKNLVCTVDAFNETLAPTTQFKLPYSRLQGGIAALIIDPEPGDIGLAVYTKRDSSNVKPEQKDPVQPGSFRMFDQADGFYIGGFLNQKPEIFLELTQDKEAILKAPKKVTIDSPETLIKGDVHIEGFVQWDKYAQGESGPAVIQGGLKNTGGEIVSNGITLETHTHRGDSGGITGEPNK